MFTGIIEHSGTIESLDVRADGGRVTIHAPRLALAVSGSIAVNGCCLTITSTSKSRFSADLSVETLRRTSFGTTNGRLTKGARVNLELPLTAGKEFGGHFVLGHIDSVGHVAHLTPEGENWCYGIEVPDEIARYIVPKGSITIDGVSFTVARWLRSPRLTLQIAVIPYTYEHTNIRDRRPGDAVNLEADILGKYIERHLTARQAEPASRLAIRDLIEQGF